MKKITLIDTYNNNGYDYEAVKEFCEINDMEVPIEGTDEYYDILNRMMEYDTEDFWDNVKYGHKLDACVVMGSLGLWDGRREIEPKIFNSLYAAMTACANDAMDIVVEQDHSTIIFKAMHHDGTNVFYIRLLNGKGYDAWNKIKYEDANINIARRVYHETLKEYIF